MPVISIQVLFFPNPHRPNSDNGTAGEDEDSGLRFVQARNCDRVLLPFLGRDIWQKGNIEGIAYLGFLLPAVQCLSAGCAEKMRSCTHFPTAMIASSRLAAQYLEKSSWLKRAGWWWLDFSKEGQVKSPGQVEIVNFLGAGGSVG